MLIHYNNDLYMLMILFFFFVKIKQYKIKSIPLANTTCFIYDKFLTDNTLYVRGCQGCRIFHKNR